MAGQNPAMPKSVFIRFAIFFTIFSATVFAQSGDFTIVALPDTQIYSMSYPQIFKAQTQWIANNAAAKNIKLVLMEGDIVNGGGETYQWQNADAAMKILDGKVPYMVAMGNHDYDQNQPDYRTASAKNFNKWFGPTRYTGQSWYKGTYTPGSNENYYGIFTFSGKEYLVLVLEAFPRDEVLAWANNVLAANHGREAILLTHAYLYYDNTRIGRCDDFNAAKIGVTDGNDGEQMWPKLVAKQPNISLVISGHVTPGDGTGYLPELGNSGNLVNQVVADYQVRTNGGNGYMRIMTFHPAMNTIDVQTYSPYTGQYLTDAENQFTMTWHAQGGVPGKWGYVSGRVRTTNCGNLKGAKITSGAYSTTTSSTGVYALHMPPTENAAVKVSLSGYLSQTATVNVPAGFNTQQEFFLSSGSDPVSGSGLSGKITSAIDGHALSGATVTVASKSVLSDANGNYSFASLATGTYTVTATKSGWGSQSTTAGVVNGGLSTANVQLATSGRVGGTVVNADGSVAAGQTVTIAGGVIVNTTSVVTNSSGAFTSGWIPVGSYQVTVNTTTAQATVTAGATANITLKLGTAGAPTSSSASVSGKVISAIDGQAIGGATVTVAGKSTLSNTAGNFSFANLATGTTTITATKSGWGQQSLSIGLAAGVNSAALKLATSGRIAGIVKSSSGAALSGATVSFSGGVIANSTHVTSSSTGTYVSTWIPVGMYKITVSKSGFATKSGTGSVTAGGKLLLDFSL